MGDPSEMKFIHWPWWTIVAKVKSVTGCHDKEDAAMKLNMNT